MSAEPVDELVVRRLVVVDEEGLERVVIGPVLDRPHLFGVDVFGPSSEQHAVLVGGGGYSAMWVTYDDHRRIGFRAGPLGMAEAFVSDGGHTSITWPG